MPLVRSPSLPFSSPLEHPKGVQGTRFLGRREGGREASLALQSSPFAPVLRSRSFLTSRSHPTSIAPYAGHGTKTRGNGNLGPQGAGEPGTPTRAGRPRNGGPRWPSPGQGAVSYLRGSCREGRRGSATIPGLNVLPLSPYPSIQLGLLPLASPWKKFRRKGRKKKINHAAEKRQPCSAGGSSEPGGPVHLRHGRPVSPTPHPAARPRPRHPSFASPPMSRLPRAPPP